MSMVLATRYGLTNYLAAAHHLNDIGAFEVACHAMLLHIEALVKQFTWAPEMVAVELTLALMINEQELAQSLAKSILDGPTSSNPYIEPFQAALLAALVLGDHAHALHVVDDLLAFIETTKLKRVEREQGALWATAINQVLSGNDEEANATLLQLRVLHTKDVDRELAKFKRGGNTAISAFDFMDIPALGLSAFLSA